MIFNPEHGAEINLNIEGFAVHIPVGTLRTVPFACKDALLRRYPWLHEVVDHPTHAPKDLPPTAVVEEEEAVEPDDESQEEEITEDVPTMPHKITQEDLELNPELAEQGVSLGDIIELPLPEGKKEQKNLIRAELEANNIKHNARHGAEKLLAVLVNNIK